MNKNTIKLAIRQILKNKIFTGINVLGLCIGITCCILAFLYVQDELKYDTHFTNTENVYRLLGNNLQRENIDPGQPARFLPYILENVPEIEEGVRISWSEFDLEVNDNYFTEVFTLVDSNFFNFFGWNLLVGNPDEVLVSPFSVVISECKAKEYFGTVNPIGKTLKIDKAFDVSITGVFKNLPEQSHLKADILLSINTTKTIQQSLLESWGIFGCFIYLKATTKSNIEILNSKISKIWNEKERKITAEEDIHFYLQPFSEVYLYSGKYSENAAYSKIGRSVGLAVIAIIVLIIVCFNFVNLSMAQLSNRSKEAGIKKILSASRFSLFSQLIFETLLLISFSLIISIGLLHIFKSEFQSFFEKEIVLSIFKNPALTGFLFIIATILLAATTIYPAFSWSRVNPINAIKGHNFLLKNNPKWNINKVLLIFQFSLGIFLMVTVVLVNKQMNFIRTRDVGFNREQVLAISNFDDDKMDANYQLFKEKLEKYTEVKMVSAGNFIPSNGISNWGHPALPETPDQDISASYTSVDYNYFDLLETKFLSGRNFTNNLLSDTKKIIINETCRKALHLTTPIGTKLTNLWGGSDKEIIGVVNDIEYNTIHEKTKPMVFFYHHTRLPYSNNILVKLQSENLIQSISIIKNEWEGLFPTKNFSYDFLDDKFNNSYRKETRIATILNILTFCAVFLCYLGLFGLTLFLVRNKIKEIGIRKVNGAKVSEILSMLNKDFIKWVAIAFVVACPIAYYAMNKWLENFAYKTTLSWWIFALAGVLALGIALLTVSWQSWQAATRNPVEALRYE